MKSSDNKRSSLVAKHLLKSGALTPDAALRMARATPRLRPQRAVTSRDYLRAMEVLRKRGYTLRGAAAHLVSLGCPFTAGTLMDPRCMGKRGRSNHND